MATVLSEYLNKILPKKAQMSQDTTTCKPCTACSDAKKAKEKCIAEKGEAMCKDLIKAHEECIVKNGGKLTNGTAAKNGTTAKNGTAAKNGTKAH